MDTEDSYLTSQTVEGEPFNRNHEDSVKDNSDENIDPINDIVDYLVRCAKISFKNAHLNEAEIRTTDKIEAALNLYQKSPTEFLLNFGKYLAVHHLKYFEKSYPLNAEECEKYKECIRDLKMYHSDESKRKRLRNRRYKALQKLKDETDYFSEKQMMFRNPLLYEQLIGQYLSEKEIQDRDKIDSEQLSFLNIILDTVDRNELKEKKHKQVLEESILSPTKLNEAKCTDSSGTNRIYNDRKRWGEFETAEPEANHLPRPRIESLLSAPERKLLREEFYNEMYSSFLEGKDDIDYSCIDNNEQYDDLQLVSQDAEDRYFDSELNYSESLEEHMTLVEEYGTKKVNCDLTDDPLDEFMKHLNKRSM